MTKINNLNSFIRNAIDEDVGDGDHTSLSCIPDSLEGSAKLNVKEDAILAGVNIASVVFHEIDEKLQMDIIKSDGQKVSKGDVAFEVRGKVLSILKAERLVLNIMQRMSGIATQTRRYADRLEGLKTKVLDTRKTTPGMRLLEKEAVRLGGGVNHRMGLYDMILLKDNHIDFSGGILNAVNRAADYLEKTGRELPVEVEARSLEDVRAVIGIPFVQRVMFDNFSVEMTAKAVQLVGGIKETESSGGITLDTVRSYAECGVDFVSVGALTHNVKGIDLSLKATF